MTMTSNKFNTASQFLHGETPALPVPDNLASFRTRPIIHVEQFANDVTKQLLSLPSILCLPPLPKPLNPSISTSTSPSIATNAYIPKIPILSKASGNINTIAQGKSHIQAPKHLSIDQLHASLLKRQKKVGRTTTIPKNAEKRMQKRPRTRSTTKLLEENGVEVDKKKQPSTCHLSIAIYDSEAPTKSIELSIPVQKSLYTLIDHIPCSAPTHHRDTKAKQACVLFIENTFYLDNRFDKQATEDLPICQYLSENENNHPNVQVLNVQNGNIRLKDLNICIGKPYVFIHHHECEHIVIFTDLCAEITPPPPLGKIDDDQMNIDIKPHGSNYCGEEEEEEEEEEDKYNKDNDSSDVKVLWKRPLRIFVCDICKQRKATKFTLNDAIMKLYPCNYCDLCFSSTHYASDGQLFRESENISFYYHGDTV